MNGDFFRSMNLQEDLQSPERFSHYRPTRRALPIVEAIGNAGATTMVIAPYGSGKTLAAGVGALVVRNQKGDKSVVKTIAERVSMLDGLIGSAMAKRARTHSQGAVIVLSGLVHDPLREISSALGMGHVPKTVEGFGKAMKEGGWSHVAIVWDEFGRHLEGLVSEGRSGELDIVQRLAERVSRADGPTMSMTLLLHQNLLAYATRLNETSRSEWRKVEGRFQTIRMVEDSQEIYDLIGEVVTELRPPNTIVPEVTDDLVKGVIDAGWFDHMEDPEQVRSIISASYPMTPGALQILPTIVARVGQNERSLFSFLREIDLGKETGINAVYDAFSDAMRTDVGIGGTYRRWIETESARSRAKGSEQKEVLAAACLLQLGGSGERRRLPRSVLELGVHAAGRDGMTVTQAIDDLIDNRLLLWRKHNDDVAVWHGADIDVALRVREERDRRTGEFDLRAFLEERFPAPYLRAPGHNAKYGVNRFLKGSYASLEELKAKSANERQTGAVVYLLAESNKEINAAIKHVKRNKLKHTVTVVPGRPLEVESAALDLVAIEALRRDEEFLATDPMVVTEIDELQSVAFGQLATLMRGLLDPRGGTSTWLADGKVQQVDEDRPATVAASRLLDEWYSSTPRIANEQLMRQSASRTMQTARVRVVGSILEKAGKPRLGYEPGDRSAEASIYRTVIENTGLRRADAMHFSSPHEIKDSGLAEVWSQIGAFYSDPTTKECPGRLEKLLCDLEDGPTGLPRAVMPLLLAAGYKHFARSVSIYQDGAYIPDVLGYAFDNLVSHPQGVTIRVDNRTRLLADYLSDICYTLVHTRPGDDEELVRAAHDAIQQWHTTVSDGTRRSRRLKNSARALLRVTTSVQDPAEMLLKGLPEAFGEEGIGPAVITRIARARNEIDELREEYSDEAVSIVDTTFRTRPDLTTTRDVVSAWAACFDAKEIESKGEVRIVDRSILRKAIETANGHFEPKSLANALSSILLQRSLDKWDDRTGPQFRSALRDARERIEAAALDAGSPDPAMRPIVEAKINELQELLAKMVLGGDNAFRMEATASEGAV